MPARRRGGWKILAAALILAAAALALRARYESQLRQQIWPDRAPDITIISNSVSAPARTVLLLGDSRMAQWQLPPLSNWRVINAGTSGLTTGQIRLRSAALMDQFHPDVLVFEGGINDLKFLGLEPALADQMVSLVSSNITAMADEGTQRHIKVILLKIWPAGPLTLARRCVWSEAVAPAVDQVNQNLESLQSRQRGVCFVDLFKQAGIGPESKFYLDTLHLKPETYSILTPFLNDALSAVTKSDDHPKP